MPFRKRGSRVMDRIQAMSDKADYETMKATVLEVVSRHFRPEFINRIDDVVVFHALEKKQVRAIADIQIERLAKRVREQDIEIDVSARARDLIANAGFDPVYGARPLKRAVQMRLETRLAEELLASRAGPGDRIRVDAVKGELVFECIPATASS